MLPRGAAPGMRVPVERPLTASAWASGNQHIAVALMSSSVANVSSSSLIPIGAAEALDELDEGVRLSADRAEDLAVALECLPLDQPHERRSA